MVVHNDCLRVPKYESKSSLRSFEHNSRSNVSCPNHLSWHLSIWSSSSSALSSFQMAKLLILSLRLSPASLWNRWNTFQLRVPMMSLFWSWPRSHECWNKHGLLRTESFVVWLSFSFTTTVTINHHKSPWNRNGLCKGLRGREQGVLVYSSVFTNVWTLCTRCCALVPHKRLCYDKV